MNFNINRIEYNPLLAKEGKLMLVFIDEDGLTKEMYLWYDEFYVMLRENGYDPKM